MILLNFSHAITPMQKTQIATLAGQGITRIIDMPIRLDEQQPFPPQLQTLVAQVALTPTQWQSEPLLVVLPSLNFIAAALLAELHGRMGYFPPVVRTRPVADVVPRRFEVAEILDLQGIRETARKAR